MASLTDWVEREVSRIGLGGPGSGNYQHKGRPGQVGGSSTTGAPKSSSTKFSGKLVSTIANEDGEEVPIYKVEKGMDSILKDTPSSWVAVGIRGKNNGVVLSASGVLIHSQMIEEYDNTDTQDNWVRFMHDRSRNVMEVGIDAAGVNLDAYDRPEKAINLAKLNIKAAKQSMKSKGYTGSWMVYE